jgi:hypothetical protein
MLSRCEYIECEKYNSCGRTKENGTVIDFKNICPNHNYKWYMKADEIIVVGNVNEELKDTQKE